MSVRKPPTALVESLLKFTIRMVPPHGLARWRIERRFLALMLHASLASIGALS